jgi:hypothetical protein
LNSEWPSLIAAGFSAGGLPADNPLIDLAASSESAAKAPNRTKTAKPQMGALDKVTGMLLSLL